MGANKGKFGEILMQQAGGLAGNAAGGLMGMAMAGWNDKRQLKQQRKLNEMQLAMDMQMTDFNYAKQLQMWKDTGYEAQLKQMKEAGINPALMYGMGGGGGQSTGGGGGHVSAPSAPQGGGEIMGMMQLRAQQAQIELLKAQTEKTKAEAEKTSTVDTELGKEQTNVAKAEAILKTWQGKLANIEHIVKNQTIPEQVNTIQIEMQKIGAEFKALQQQTGMTEATWETQIKTAQAELVSIGIEQALKQAQTKLADKQIWKMSEEVAQQWKKLSLEEQRIVIEKGMLRVGEENANTQRWNAELGWRVQEFNEWLNNLNAKDRLVAETIGKVLQGAAFGGAMGGAGSRPIIGGFKPR